MTVVKKGSTPMTRVKSDLSELEVLFVDDEEQTLKYLSRAFSSLCRVRLAANVAEALVVLKSSKTMSPNIVYSLKSLTTYKALLVIQNQKNLLVV